MQPLNITLIYICLFGGVGVVVFICILALWSDRAKTDEQRLQDPEIINNELENKNDL